MDEFKSAKSGCSLELVCCTGGLASGAFGCTVEMKGFPFPNKLNDANAPRISHRNHRRNSHLRASDVAGDFRADHLDAGRPIFSSASTLVHAAALGGRRTDQSPFFRLSVISRNVPQRGRAALQDQGG